MAPDYTPWPKPCLSCMPCTEPAAVVTSACGQWRRRARLRAPRRAPGVLQVSYAVVQREPGYEALLQHLLTLVYEMQPRQLANTVAPAPCSQAVLAVAAYSCLG